MLPQEDYIIRVNSLFSTSTTVGTLEFRAIQEPIRTIPKVKYHQANVNVIAFDKKILHCSDAFVNGYHFNVPYDGLVIAPGSLGLHFCKYKTNGTINVSTCY